MSGSILTELLLPIALAFIMFGMGLSLTSFDFLRVWQAPRSVILGLFGQLVCLPLLGFLICLGLQLPVELAMGVMVLAACPGGSMSNVLSHLAKANLALSVSLTAVGTLACIVTAPFIIYLATVFFVEHASQQYSLLSISLKLFVFTLLPVLCGMVVRHLARYWAVKVEPIFRGLALVFLVLLVIGVVAQELEVLQNSFSDVVVACLGLNLISIVIGLLLAKFGGLQQRDGLTLAIEIGVQNSTMAMLVALSIMQQPGYAIVAGVYGLTMYIGVALLMLYAKYTTQRAQALQT
ncbi:bile acid:sodium symporter family protein [Shewanella gelidii]|uniref:Bile acid:sodium symporter family protein n=1 Tax=Shewanella gelidii TaxID=1642821 RepID=A0A917JIS4_9GAMM|nr:bile acid:sodium symporter family protein [Shewanella gelidii]MCL1096933.1 bile acid:sodium symporter family protein [Shewanella gelidii]GGI71328.1 hypothetical protein GCM10009332_05770 [Shewanella gelidii]